MPAGAALVERTHELEVLAGLVADSGCVALIEGPAGIGKTRLLTEVRDRAVAAGARTLTARGASWRSPNHHPNLWDWNP